MTPLRVLGTDHRALRMPGCPVSLNEPSSDLSACNIKKSVSLNSAGSLSPWFAYDHLCRLIFAGDGVLHHLKCIRNVAKKLPRSPFSLVARVSGWTPVAFLPGSIEERTIWSGEDDVTGIQSHEERQQFVGIRQMFDDVGTDHQIGLKVRSRL